MDRSLWLHLVSVHADPVAAMRPTAENERQHEAEHHGPGTIRHHPVGDLSFNPDTAQAVLVEWLDGMVP